MSEAPRRTDPDEMSIVLWQSNEINRLSLRVAGLLADAAELEETKRWADIQAATAAASMLRMAAIRELFRVELESYDRDFESFAEKVLARLPPAHD